MLRTTAGHSALLIDGQGHQYHDGSEGTNPSDAMARIVRKRERNSHLTWASDATPAYQLALPDVESVTRTVVMLLRMPAVIVIDKVLKKTAPSTLKARYFGFNIDGKGRVEAQTPRSFALHRPLARLDGVIASPAGTVVETPALPIPEDVARQHPFIEAGTAEASLEPLLVTILTPHRTNDPDARIAWDENEDVYTVTIERSDYGVSCLIYDNGTLPEFEVKG
jgi:hypothetical protein